VLADTSKNTTEELHGTSAQHAASDKAARPHPAPSNSREVPPDVVIQSTEEGTMGGKKRHKHCCQDTATTANDDSDINKLAGSASVVGVVAITGSGKRQARPTTDVASHP
jgi:hypothetical protein